MGAPNLTGVPGVVQLTEYASAKPINLNPSYIVQIEHREFGALVRLLSGAELSVSDSYETAMWRWSNALRP